MIEQRSTLDLVRELEAEARKFREIALVVGFEDHSEVIFDSDGTTQQKLEKLNALHRSGGVPIGFVGYTADALGTLINRNTLTLYTRALDEFLSDQFAADALQKIVVFLKENLEKLPGATIVSERGGWVN